MRLILGSASPRRLELLGQIGLVPHHIRPPEIDETPHSGELPRAYCSRMAEEKARAVDAGKDDVVLCADTTVAVGRRILGKPVDADEARRFLALMSGRRHRVITAVAVKAGATIRSRDQITQVRLKRLSTQEIEGYLATDDWRGKAGGYAIQGPAAAFIPWIQGSYSGVMGLPLSETATLLQAAGLEIWP